MFAYLVAAAVTLPAVILWTFWDSCRTQNVNPLAGPRRLRYVAGGRLLMAASSVSIVTLIIAIQASPSLAALRLTRWAVASLIVSVVSSALTLQALARRPASPGPAPGARFHRGHLLSVLIAAYFAVTGLLAALVFLARGAFLL